MPVPRLRLRLPAWLRWPRRTARLRFTALYGGLFLLSGAALVAITYVLFERATEYTKPHLPQIPRTPAIQQLVAAAVAKGACPAETGPESAGTGPASADHPVRERTAARHDRSRCPEPAWHSSPRTSSS